MELPFKMLTSAHPANLDDLLRSLNSASFFIYKQGGEPEAPYYNTYQARLIREVERSGRFVELPYHWILPDGGKVRVFQNSMPWWSTAKQGFIPSGVKPIPSCRVNFSGKLELTGFSVERTRKSLRVKYQWTCLEHLGHEYWCFTHILDDRGRIIGFLDHPILGGEPPMETWMKGDTAIEELEFPLTSPHTNNTLSVSLGLFERTSGQRLVISSFDLPETMKASPADSDTALIVRPR